MSSYNSIDDLKNEYETLNLIAKVNLAKNINYGEWDDDLNKLENSLNLLEYKISTFVLNQFKENNAEEIIVNKHKYKFSVFDGNELVFFQTQIEAREFSFTIQTNKSQQDHYPFFVAFVHAL
jgi:hypothetical protein